MGAVTFVTGGRRSGKSAYAQRLAESMEAPRLYIATCPVIDEETRERVEAHKKAREGRGWETLEETVDLAGAIRGSAGHKTVLVECVTLWVNNLMYEAEQKHEEFVEGDAERAVKEVLEACGEIGADVVFVSNEIGWGIVPENELARRFSDVAGKVNQAIAKKAGTAIMVVSGMPVRIKTGGNNGVD